MHSSQPNMYGNPYGGNWGSTHNPNWTGQQQGGNNHMSYSTTQKSPYGN
jgi:hypothetical protein